MEQFAHDYLESEEPEAALAAQADLILADLRGLEVPAALETLCASRQADAQLIVLTEREQFPLLADHLEQIRDVWTVPMSEAELRFRFSRWQQACLEEKNLWETSQYLEATINSIPSLVWYKTKDGIHEKVNDSFCITVNKTKADVEGRGHAYIWDVENDDPACIESEREVMEQRKTCISEETVQTRDGTKLLTTYKSPLYDLDGSVMGTVGVGIDITMENEYKQRLISKTNALETLFTTMDCGILCHLV